MRFDIAVGSRYTRPMPGTSLPPHLERFVRQQIAAGGYHSADEVIRAALHLLEGATLAETPAAPRPAGAALGWSRPSRPAVSERWQTPAEWRASSPAPGTLPPLPRRSPRGLLADLPSHLTFDDVRAARDELWSGLHPGRA